MWHIAALWVMLGHVDDLVSALTIPSGVQWKGASRVGGEGFGGDKSRDWHEDLSKCNVEITRCEQNLES